MSRGLPHRVTAAIMPLLDSAVLVVAKEQGTAEEHGIELELVRETSWANIRDRLAVGHFQASQLLGPMPIACNLGLSPLAARLVAPFAVGLGGNAVTVSTELWRAMAEAGAEPDLDPLRTGAALAAVVTARRRKGLARLRFAVVHPHSGHNYELRYWLAASCIDPDLGVEIVIVPPPLMADALAAGGIDGYCVGEPWSTAAVRQCYGRIATVKARIWRSSPEKVLGVERRWAEAHPEALHALIRALYDAARWCAEPAHHEALAAILAGPGYVERPADWLLPALAGRIETGEGVREVADFFVPFAKAASFPWQSHALWFYSQMVRWGDVEHTPEHAAIARDTYRPDLYRAALRDYGAPLPGANAKVEGALAVETPVGAAGGRLTLGPDGFFDGSRFDPDELAAYIEAQRRPGERPADPMG